MRNGRFARPRRHGDTIERAITPGQATPAARFLIKELAATPPGCHRVPAKVAEEPRGEPGQRATSRTEL